MTNTNSGNWPSDGRGITDYVASHPNLNDQMTPEQSDDFKRFMQVGGSTVRIIDNGSTIEFVPQDEPISVQSVEEAQRLKEDREIHLGD
ncbi:MAG: hypothetical protein M3Q79_00520 [bacterium]|nr:hypothetical protein [bacterium]